VSLAQGSYRGSTCLPAQISSGGAACHRLRATPRPPCVPWAPAPASQLRTAPGVPRVPTASGRRKNVGLSSSETELQTIVFSTRRLAQGNSRGSACPRSSRPNEKRRADVENLAEPGRCKTTPIQSKRKQSTWGGDRQISNRSRSNLRWASCSRSEGGGGASQRQRRRQPSRS
jgi:hypothetical protein